MRWKPDWVEMVVKASCAVFPAGEDWSSTSRPAFKKRVATSVTGDIVGLWIYLRQRSRVLWKGNWTPLSNAFPMELDACDVPSVPYGTIFHVAG